MRRKVFIASKTVKIAVAIFAGSAIVAGMLGYFYSQNKTLEFAGQSEHNIALVKHAGAFQNGDDYRREIDKPLLVQKRARLGKLHTLATDFDLLGAGEITTRKLIDFLDAIEANSTKATLAVPQSDPMYVEFTSNLKLMIDRILYFSESLSSNDPSEFKLKVRLYKALCEISTNFDCQGTFAANIARVGASRDILEQVLIFRQTSASDEHKDKLIAACLLELQKPYNILLMLRSEHLRVQEQMDIWEGIATTSTFGPARHKPMSTGMKLESKMPSVAKAWRSRVNRDFFFAINDILAPTEKHFNSSIFGMAERRIINDPASTEYLQFFDVDFSTPKFLFTRNEWLIYNLSRPPKASLTGENGENERKPSSNSSKVAILDKH